MIEPWQIQQALNAIQIYYFQYRHSSDEHFPHIHIQDWGTEPMLSRMKDISETIRAKRGRKLPTVLWLILMILKGPHFHLFKHATACRITLAGMRSCPRSEQFGWNDRREWKRISACYMTEPKASVELPAWFVVCHFISFSRYDSYCKIKKKFKELDILPPNNAS